MMGIIATADTSTLGGLLSLATELVTWLITTMGSYLTFITENPIIFVMFIIMIAGLGVGMLFRIWHGVR